MLILNDAVHVQYMYINYYFLKKYVFSVPTSNIFLGNPLLNYRTLSMHINFQDDVNDSCFKLLFSD
jgi:hypothetical protein